jgi:uncharacterized protein (TIGR02147 family)
MTQRISILNYSDYRSFLKDQMKASRIRNPRFSFQVWARRMGLRSQSTLVMIVNGQRNPGPELVENLIKDLHLEGREASFFRDLVVLEKCPVESRNRITIMERLASMHPRKEFRALDSKTFQAISNWHYYAIRELVDLPDFKEDPVWIQKRLRTSLTQREITEAIQTLVHLKLLARNENGQLEYPSYAASTFDIPDEGLRRFHTQILQLAQQSLHDVRPEEREVSGTTFTLRKSDLAKAKDILREALEQIGNLGRERGDEVYHIEFALFPLTKDSGEKS